MSDKLDEKPHMEHGSIPDQKPSGMRNTLNRINTRATAVFQLAHLHAVWIGHPFVDEQFFLVKAKLKPRMQPNTLRMNKTKLFDVLVTRKMMLLDDAVKVCFGGCCILLESVRSRRD